MKLALKSFYFVTSLVLISCSGEEVSASDDSKTEKPINQAPTAPKLLLPVNDLECAYSTMTFEWKASSDPEGSTVSYKLELSEQQNFEELYDSAETTNTFVSLNLENGVTYYWRVHSLDEEGNKSQHFEIRSFYTEPKLNYNSIPQNPNAENPTNNTRVDQNFSFLEWSAQDDDGDSLTFEVYFGTDNPPPLIKEDLEDTSLEINLSGANTYYWRIIAEDTKGAKAIGSIWKFHVD